MNAYDFKNAFKAYKNAEAEFDKIDQAWEADPENESIENAWNKAYETSHKAFEALCDVAVAIIAPFVKGFDKKTARAMVWKNEEKLDSLVARLA